MSRMGHHSRFRIFCLALSMFCACSNVGFAQKPGGSGGEVKGPPDGRWGELLRQFKRDPLLKKPFHMQPETDIKGLAAKIRSQELDIPNRKRAIRYLASLDCTQFPEAKEQLLLMLNPDEEKWEEVRYEAAMGLRDMFARNSCCPEVAEQAKKSKKSKAGEAEKKPCHCTTCCDAKSLNTLAKTAYEMDEKGCCYEPSLRVREMAVEAIKVCGIPCNFKPYYGTPNNEEPGPPAISNESAGGGNSTGGGEEPIPNLPTNEPIPQNNSPQASLHAEPLAPTPINRLSKVCIVALAKGQTRTADTRIYSVYRGRVYYFSDEASRQDFEANPDRYAVAFGGCDPVHFVKSKEPVEGRFLTEHRGRFYMFLTKENFAEFKANSDQYSISEGSTSAVTVTASN